MLSRSFLHLENQADPYILGIIFLSLKNGLQL